MKYNISKILFWYFTKKKCHARTTCKLPAGRSEPEAFMLWHNSVCHCTASVCCRSWPCDMTQPHLARFWYLWYFSYLHFASCLEARLRKARPACGHPWHTTWSQRVKEICGEAPRLTSPQTERVSIWCKTPQNAADVLSFRIIIMSWMMSLCFRTIVINQHIFCQAFVQQFHWEIKHMYLNHRWAIRIQITLQILCNGPVCLDSHSSCIHWRANTLRFLIVKLKHIDPLAAVQYSAEEPGLHAHADWQKPLTQSPLYVKNLPSPHGNSTL